MSIGGFFKRLFGTSHERTMRRIQPIVEQINRQEDAISALSDANLTAQTAKFREMLENGASLDDILPEAFATVREAGKRVLNMRHYDVQLIGGIVLHQGKIAEMKTGEGKTLVATTAMYLNALPGLGAHLVTVNDYLASRDADWMGQIYKFLGLSVGKILSDMENSDRRHSYNCDITYGTNNEFGFDYLRDNMKYQLSDYVQRGHKYAIVDEVDSILIDEARTPLIISGQLEQDLNLYKEINKLVPFLKRDEDYAVDEKNQSVALNETGIAKLEHHLKIDNIYEPKYIEYLHHVNKALQAHTLYKRDQNYVIENGKIVIIDDFTGRMMHGRRWSDGLHQAIEAKEGVEIQAESQTLATITFQNYFRMYDKLAGMTGTADTEAEEFKKIYKLDVVSIPTAKKIVRRDLTDVIYFNEKVKIDAIVEQIKQCHEIGQPILVGTVSVEKSEVFSKAISRFGIPHNVLNAKNHKREAEIIAQAGRKGAVTIATNMAGRGTDILLGGNPEFLAKMECGGDEKHPNYDAALKKFREQCAKEKEEVTQAGGLFILGTERHESRRIDNQLRGRAGRQGDQGASRFFLSLDDDLLRIFSGEELKQRMALFGMNEQPDIPIEAGIVSRAIETAQKRVEGRNFDIRKNLIEYDDVMNSQRKSIYTLRNNILKGENLEEEVLNAFEDIIYTLADEHMPVELAYEDWNMDAMLKALNGILGFKPVINLNAVGRGDRDGQLLLIWDEIEKHYNEQVKQFDQIVSAFEKNLGDDSPYKGQTGKELLMELAQNYYLREIDHFWRAHLTAMTGLRESISLRGYAQKDPKQEYKREAFSLFEKMMHNIKTRMLTQVCRVHAEVPDFSRMKPAQRQAMRSMQKPESATAKTEAVSKEENMSRVDAKPQSHDEQVDELRQLAARLTQKPEKKSEPKKAMSMAELMTVSATPKKTVEKDEKSGKAMSMAELMAISAAPKKDEKSGKALSMAELMAMSKVSEPPKSESEPAKSQSEPAESESETPKKAMSMADLMPVSVRQAMEDQKAIQKRMMAEQEQQAQDIEKAKDQAKQAIAAALAVAADKAKELAEKAQAAEINLGEANKTDDSKAAESKSSEPEAAESKSSEPEAAESKSSEPEIAESKPSEPEIAESKPSEPEIAESKPSEPEIAESKIEESKPETKKVDDIFNTSLDDIFGGSNSLGDLGDFSEILENSSNYSDHKSEKSSSGLDGLSLSSSLFGDKDKKDNKTNDDDDDPFGIFKNLGF